MEAAVERVFPGARLRDYHAPPVEGQKIMSSTLLQMTLYYNVQFSIVYFGLNLLMIRWKTLVFTNIRISYVTPYLFAFWVVAELGRLYVGYVGNLEEKVPHLAAFLFLTICPQLLFMSYFTWMQDPLYPLDKILGLLMVGTLIIELVVGWVATNRIIRNKTDRFAVEFGAFMETQAGPGPTGGGESDGRAGVRHQHHTDTWNQFTNLSEGGANLPGHAMDNDRDRDEGRLRTFAARARMERTPQHPQGQEIELTGSAPPRGGEQGPLLSRAEQLRGELRGAAKADGGERLSTTRRREWRSGHDDMGSGIPPRAPRTRARGDDDDERFEYGAARPRRFGQLDPMS